MQFGRGKTRLKEEGGNMWMRRSSLNKPGKARHHQSAVTCIFSLAKVVAHAKVNQQSFKKIHKAGQVHVMFSYLCKTPLVICT